MINASRNTIHSTLKASVPRAIRIPISLVRLVNRQLRVRRGWLLGPVRKRRWAINVQGLIRLPLVAPVPPRSTQLGDCRRSGRQNSGHALHVFAQSILEGTFALWLITHLAEVRWAYRLSIFGDGFSIKSKSKSAYQPAYFRDREWQLNRTS